MSKKFPTYRRVSFPPDAQVARPSFSGSNSHKILRTARPTPARAALECKKQIRFAADLVASPLAIVQYLRENQAGGLTEASLTDNPANTLSEIYSGEPGVLYDLEQKRLLLVENSRLDCLGLNSKSSGKRSQSEARNVRVNTTVTVIENSASMHVISVLISEADRLDLKLESERRSKPARIPGRAKKGMGKPPRKLVGQVKRNYRGGRNG